MAPMKKKVDDAHQTTPEETAMRARLDPPQRAAVDALQCGLSLIDTDLRGSYSGLFGGTMDDDAYFAGKPEFNVWTGPGGNVTLADRLRAGDQICSYGYPEDRNGGWVRIRYLHTGCRDNPNGGSDCVNENPTAGQVLIDVFHVDDAKAPVEPAPGACPDGVPIPAGCCPPDARARRNERIALCQNRGDEAHPMQYENYSTPEQFESLKPRARFIDACVDDYDAKGCQGDPNY